MGEGFREVPVFFIRRQGTSGYSKFLAMEKKNCHQVSATL